MRNKDIFICMIFVLLSACIASCTYIPPKAKVVSDFEKERYLGTWYEIARTDNRFEKNMDNVIAQYSLLDNGDVAVLNSGYDHTEGKWKSAKGQAKFRGDVTEAALKVSFFKPFYAGYNVVRIDNNYKYALVAGRNLDYLWLLSRDKSVPDSIKNDYLKTAKNIGYDTLNLIWVGHNRNNPFVKEENER